MKLRDAVLISLAAGFLIIGIHQTLVLGFGYGYWAIMISTLLFFVITHLRRKSR